MSRTLTRVNGTGAAGIFTPAPKEPWLAQLHAQRVRDNLDINNLYLQRNVFAGGSDQIGIDASVAGDVRLLNSFPIEIDNSGTQLSGFSDANGATLVARFRYLVRVSDAAITFTPKVVYGATISTMTTVATITGEAACSATPTDYSGANQYQTVLFTVPSGVKLFLPIGTIAGTPAAGFQVWPLASYDLFVQST